MNRNPNHAVPQNQSLQKFLKIYEKMVSDSHSLARRMALPIKREEGQEPKNSGQPS